MHDVLVLALTIFFIKSQGVYDASSLNGVYFFTAAVVLMILSYAWIRTDGMAAAPELVPVLPEPDVGQAAKPSGWRNFALSFLIILATVFFALGIILPTIRFTTVYVWTNEHSILTIMYALSENKEYFLCAVVFAVSVFFPFLKLFYLLTLITAHDMPADFRKKSIATMEWVGRYSMTDVMVLALMIFYVNSSGYTEARVLPGVYFLRSLGIDDDARLWVGQRRAAYEPAQETHQRRRPANLDRPRASPATAKGSVVFGSCHPGRSKAGPEIDPGPSLCHQQEDGSRLVATRRPG